MPEQNNLYYRYEFFSYILQESVFHCLILSFYGKFYEINLYLSAEVSEREYTSNSNNKKSYNQILEIGAGIEPHDKYIKHPYKEYHILETSDFA